MDTNINPAVKTVLFSATIGTLLLGLICLLAPEALAVSQAFGVLFILVTLANAGAAVFKGTRRKTALAYLWFTGVALLFLPMVLFVRSALEEFGPVVLNDILVFGSLALGALVNLPFRTKTGIATVDQMTPSRNVLRLVLSLLVACIPVLILAAQTAAVSVTDSGFLGVFWGQCLPYAGMAACVMGALAWHSLLRAGLFRRFAWIAVLPGIAALVLGFVPLFQTPGILFRADAAFMDSFGTDVSAVSGLNFTAVPLDLGTLFIGSPAPAVREEKDIVYLTETAANNKSYSFKFDHYGPMSPGKHPVLIRIHGGAWVIGDKGFSNGNFMNLHFAALGYEVFDLQYGLNDTAKFEMVGLPPGPLQGPWSIDDMVRQLSSFTSYLADHAEALQADTSRVVVSGGSAGGQLAMALVLAGTSGYRDRHPGIGFDPRLTVRGIVAFYPAVAGDALGIPGDKDVIDTTPLISPRNPPVLAYQGGLDGLVNADTVRKYARTFRAAGPAGFALVEFPVAGHGSDLIYWGSFNQVFVYYMERFLAIESR